MNQSLKNLVRCTATSAFLFTLAATTWAVPFKGAAHLFAWTTGNVPLLRMWEGEIAAGKREIQARVRLPVPVFFHEAGGRGLLLSVWINNTGPYTFAIDTGAGATVLSRRAADEARVSISGKRPLMIGGISGASSVAGQEVLIRSLAVGTQDNILPAGSLAIVTERLAPGIDGILDPTEAYWPLGFEIDMPRGKLTAFDPHATPLRRNQNLQPEGTIVSWLTDGQSRRPFVMLEGGRRVLLDTGSGFGLAVTQEAAISLGIMPSRGREHSDVRDLADGSIAAHRVSPATVSIGSLVLRGIPTDLLPNARSGSPILLGRDALRPFRLAFDPVNRLVRIVPG